MDHLGLKTLIYLLIFMILWFYFFVTAVYKFTSKNNIKSYGFAYLGLLFLSLVVYIIYKMGYINIDIVPYNIFWEVLITFKSIILMFIFILGGKLDKRYIYVVLSIEVIFFIWSTLSLLIGGDIFTTNKFLLGITTFLYLLWLLYPIIIAFNLYEKLGYGGFKGFILSIFYIISFPFIILQKKSKYNLSSNKEIEEEKNEI